MTGNSFYKYIHPCDHEEVAKELCGKIPLEDMEIFDGLFCSDSVFMMSNNLKGGMFRDISTHVYTCNCSKLDYFEILSGTHWT